ncbi:MAG: DNRLRE domain-containing protein [Planctomycetota bacterium]
MVGSRLAAITIASLLVATARAGSTIAIVSDRDNTLYQSGFGDVSNGAGQHFFTGKTIQLNDSLRRGVLHFDIAGNIPAGSRIDVVSLTLNCSRVRFGSPTVTVTLRSLLADWGEGSSDASGQEGPGTSATTGDATWLNTFFNTGTWTNPGGDFLPTPSGSASVGSAGSYTFASTAQMVADVQAWLDSPAANFGWAVIADEVTGGSVKRFDSRENPTAANRPTLTIEYCPPASFTNYGAGLPGTLGVPALTLTNPPVLCSSTTLNIGNSLGSPTGAVLFLGLARASIPTVFGAPLLVLPTYIVTLTLPGPGLSATFATLCGDAYCGLVIDMQVLEFDPGAVHGVSFSQGLELIHGL